MGLKPVILYSDPKHLNEFVYVLINDIKTLEQMLESGKFEGDVQRVGAEQELCLLSNSWRPATIAMEVLEELDDPHFSTEHSQYNMEINLDPLVFNADCLSAMEKNLHGYLSHLRGVVAKRDGHIILVGILPTIRRSDLHLENLTPLPRYQMLNETLNRMKSGPYEFRIEGIDELMTRHNSIMFEGCNTSFQVHYQLSPSSFVEDYNWAQAIAGPVLATATNSPMLLGKRLWQETRIALFQQSVDTRRSSYDLREKNSRVSFGNRWLTKSITELFKEEIARFRVLIGTESMEDSVEVYKSGGTPRLQALQMHNGTVYHWNRACYGITDGKPHIRIENRYLPAGPTVVDETANAAFWLGLMNGRPDAGATVADLMEFGEAKRNFFSAARSGLDTQFRWLNNKTVPADQLILKELLPLAKEGLARAGILKEDADRYLGVIEERVRSRMTGSRWILKSCEKMCTDGLANYEACVAITAGIVGRQESGKPVHQWKFVDINEAGDWINRFWKVEHIMVTDLFTVQETDLAYFASNVMTWKHIRYVPVEDEKGKLVGLLSSRALLALHSNGAHLDTKTALVGDIMIKNPLTVSPGTLTIDALTTMRKHRVGCLPVTSNGNLVGIVTETDFMNFSELTIAKLVEESATHAKLEKENGRKRKSK